TVKVLRREGIFAPFDLDEEMDVWMSHGDRLTKLPEGFHVIGESQNAPLAAIADPVRRFYGIQFHPEVAHTPKGAQVLSAFLFDVARLVPDWTPGKLVDEAVQNIQLRVAPNERAICALSGGGD